MHLQPYLKSKLKSKFFLLSCPLSQAAAGLALPPVLQWMDAHAANYLSLPISTTFRHLNRCFSKYQGPDSTGKKPHENSHMNPRDLQ